MSEQPPVPSVPPAPGDLSSDDFPVLWPVGTRWADNDMFGHLNNAVYYQLFDTAINAWINTTTGTDPITMPALGIVAESGCRYFSELHFPQDLAVGLAVTRLGRSSVTYRLGMFEVATGSDREGGGAGRSGSLPSGRSDREGGGAGRSGSLSFEPPSKRLTALGHWVHVYVDRISRKAVPIPSVIRELLATACVDIAAEQGRPAT